MGATFDVYRLPEEHAAIRDAVREVCAAKVAPNAAAADENSEFPQASYEALRAADFHAPHIPEVYGGATSLVPAVNKLGTLPLLLAGSEELKREFLPPVARGEAMFSYCLSEPEAGSDAAALSTRADRDGDWWVVNGVKRFIN